MTTETIHPSDFLGMVDHEKGLVDRRIFSDEEIYQLELERIFARAWNFMAHDSMIPNPGDFFMTFIGEDRVIVVRDRAGEPQVLLNTCRHRGNAVCRAEEGHATSFMCTYHGWTYDLQGKLVGVPGFKDYYHEDLDREAWGLIRAAQVDSYKGFIFATLDPEAPSFPEFLGEVGRLSLDTLAEKGEEMVVVGGIQKFVIDCNWKFAVDNVWDFYHASITHASQLMSGWEPADPRRNRPSKRPQMALLAEYGHVLAGPEFVQQSPEDKAPPDWRTRPSAVAALGPLANRLPSVHPHIFPNFWVTVPGAGQVSLRIPKGPTSTEIWWFTFLDKATPQRHREQMHSALHTFGPAGMFEQEDGENWGQSTRGSVGTVARRYPLHYAMGVGRGEVIEDELSPPRVERDTNNEHAQLWFYRSWTEWLAAENWSDLKANHSILAGAV